jgi:tetratricopeptide (TPR) repeat protein
MLSLQVGLEDPGPDAEEIVSVAKLTSDPELVGWIQVLLGEVSFGRGDVGAVEALWKSALEYYSSQDNSFSTTVVLFIEGNRALMSGDHARAERLFADAVPVGFDCGSPTFAALCLQQVSTLAESRGDYALAADSLERAMQATNEVGFGGYEVTTLTRLANLAGLIGNSERAEALYAEAYRVADQGACQSVLAQTLSGLALRHRHAGRHEQAENITRRALSVYRESGFAPGVVASLCTLGFLAESRGEVVEAEGHHREALAEARLLADPRPRNVHRRASRSSSGIRRRAARSRAARGVGPTSRYAWAATRGARPNGRNLPRMDCKRSR